MIKKRHNIGKSYHEFLIHLVKSLLRHYHEYKINRQYIRGYKQMPETEEEVEAFFHIACISIAENPW